jgi:hypothetical protein
MTGHSGGRGAAGFSSRGRTRDEQRRKAAFYLRQHAADDLDRAAKLDGLPALRLLDEHVEAIAQTIGIPVDDLVAAAMRLWPDEPAQITTPTNQESELHQKQKET